MRRSSLVTAALLLSTVLLAPARGEAQGNLAAITKPKTSTLNQPAPADPCCQIVAIDARTGVVTAKIKATGKLFQFRPNSATLSTLALGQSVYANFTKSQVSLDGRTVCCSLGPVDGLVPVDGAGPVDAVKAIPTKGDQAQPPDGTKGDQAEPPDGRSINTGMTASARPAPVQPCCEIVSVDAKVGVVTAKVKANGKLFQFKPVNRNTLEALTPGQGVFVNFARGQISLDGRTVCCTVLSPNGIGPVDAVRNKAEGTQGSSPTGSPLNPPDGAAPPARDQGSAAPVAAPPPSSSAQPATANGSGKSNAIGRVQPIELPSIAYGAPQPMPTGRRPTDLVEARQITSRVGGKDVTAKIIRLRGISGIESASGIPDGARRLLEIHVRTLDPNEPHDYIVNTELAAQWIQSHPVPADIKTSDNGSHRQHCSGADYVTKANCDYQAAGDAVKAIQNEAKKDWNHASDELTHDWNMTQGCFADHTLPLNDIPVRFSIAPSLTIPLSVVGEAAGLTTTFDNGTSSAKVDGSVGLGFPMQSDFTAQLDLFYIPCLPFVIRPRSIAADGTMTVGETLSASVTASGKFDKTFKIPLTGGAKIPVEMIPIVIAGVPVAELDVSAFIEGNVEVGGNGKAEGHFKIDNPHKARIAFACDGGGCRSSAHQIPDPATLSEGAEISGQVFVKPSVYTALQLDFNYDLLGARAGAEPYILGVASGCAETSGQQATNGASTGEENHALTADLDWGVKVRAEALIAGKVVGNPYLESLTREKHLWFRDLAPGGSTALIPNVQSVGAAAAMKPTAYKVKMPKCYPYTNRILYQVTWTGGATPTSNPACQWLNGQGKCQFDPTKDLLINLTWPAAGNYSLTVRPLSDEHHRSFSPAPEPTQIAVTVSPAG